MNEINQTLTLHRAYEHKPALCGAPTAAPKASEGDMLALVIYAMMDTVNVTSDSAVIHAKELQNNANAQQALNNKAAKLPWNNVPKMKMVNHTVRKAHYHYIGKGEYTFAYYTYKHYQTCANATAVENQMAKNQRVSQERQVIQGHLSVLQQDSSVEQDNITAVTDCGMQSMRAGQFMEDAVRQLTDKVMSTLQN